MTPKLIAALDGIRVVDIACGNWHSVFLTDSGDVYTAGWNHFGQLGQQTREINDPATRGIPTWVQIGEEEEITIASIAAGSAHTLALSS